MNSHVNSSPLAPIHRGASRCRTESAKAQPENTNTSMIVSHNIAILAEKKAKTTGVTTIMQSNKQKDKLLNFW
jgi:hypothetical protein